MRIKKDRKRKSDRRDINSRGGGGRYKLIEGNVLR